MHVASSERLSPRSLYVPEERLQSRTGFPATTVAPTVIVDPLVWSMPAPVFPVMVLSVMVVVEALLSVRPPPKLEAVLFATVLFSRVSTPLLFMIPAPIVALLPATVLESITAVPVFRMPPPREDEAVLSDTMLSVTVSMPLPL